MLCSRIKNKANQLYNAEGHIIIYTHIKTQVVSVVGQFLIDLGKLHLICSELVIRESHSPPRTMTWSNKVGQSHVFFFFFSFLIFIQNFKVQ